MPASHLRKAFSTTLRIAGLNHFTILLLLAILLAGIVGVSGANAAQGLPSQAIQTIAFGYQSSSCIQAPDGLIDWWTADGNSYDLVGGHHGTLVNGTTYAPGMIGQAFSFDGVNDSIDLGNWFNYQDFTITMWVKPGTTQLRYADIIDNNHGSGISWVVQQNSYTTNQYYFNSLGPINLVADQWQHLAISHDSAGNYRAYLNGVLLGSNTSGAINYNGAQFLRLGRWGGGGRYWKGLMDEVDVYNRALADAEVVALFEAGTAGKCPDQSTIEIANSLTVANGVDDASIIVILKDSDGNVLQNYTVSMQASGSGNTITGSPTQTGSDGSVTFTLTSTRAEEKTLTFFDETQGSVLYLRPTVTFVSGPVSAQKSSITTSVADARDDGVTPVSVVVTALDGYDNPIPFVNVNLFATGSTVITPVNSVTDAQGKAVFEVTDAVTETVTVTAEADGVLIDNSAQIRFHCRIDGDLTVVSGDTCSLDAGSYTFDNLLVKTGGTLLIKGNTSANRGVTINATTVTVETGGTISADKTGYPSSSGPGAGQGAVWTGGGAGYGGIGQSGNGSGGAAYGSVTEPKDLGSGGGWGKCGLISTCPGGLGGGALRLIVGDTLRIDGTISADGIAGGGRSGGGSGGSIWIETSALAGNGLIHANGGSGLNGGGSGAGGRIAVYYASSAFPLDGGHVYARGHYQTTNGGGPGTVYLKDTAANMDKLVVDNDGNSVTTYAVHLPGDYAYDQIELSGKGTLRISGSASRFTLIGNDVLAGDGTGKLQVEGTIITSADLLLSEVALTILGNIEGAQNVTLEAPGVLELYATSPLHTGSYSFTSITVRNGATLKLVSSGNGDTNYSNDPGVKLNLANLTVEAGGKVSADGTGYPGAHEAGTGPGAGKSAWATGGGGGHGGYGQNAAGAGGSPYDSVPNPILPGSSGGAGQDIYHNYLPGGAGGGAIWLVVSDTLQVDGEISADGVIGSGRSGGGSGGSILIETTNLTGTGGIHANGGPNSGGGDGGGGRIAVYATNNSGSVSYSAQGGPIWRTGGEGTIFLNDLDPNRSSVQISPPSVVADGVKTGKVTVTLIDVDGNPMPDKLVELALFSGQSLSLNGQSLGLYQYVSIGQTDANGIVTAQLTATTIGARTIKARSGQESISQVGTVEFIEKPVVPSVREESVVSSGDSSEECNDGIGCPVNNTQGTAGGPINTRTGGYDYTETDLSFLTSAGELSFVRTYSSLALDLPTSLSPGWTHNQDMRLFFPDDPGGQPGTVLLKSRSANQYAFFENPDGSYEAAPGIRAKLVHKSDTVYTVTDSGQNTYVFDENGRMTTYANPQGQAWEYTYNASGNLTKVSANSGTSYLNFTYDAQGRIASVGDHSGRSVSYDYDAAGDLVSVTDVLGQTWTYSYDAAHRITQVTAPDQSFVERTEYDSQGRAVRQYDGEGDLVVELTFNPNGSTTITDALGNTQTHSYDERGTLVGETDAVEAEKTTEYGYNFQPTQVSNAAGHTLTMTWSEDGNDLLSKTDPAGNTTQNTYDALHNLTSTIDPLGNTTTYTYDGKLMTSSTDALGGVTSYTYTPEGYLASTTDPAGRMTSYTYNSFGQLASMTLRQAQGGADPSGQTWTYTYDLSVV